MVLKHFNEGLDIGTFIQEYKLIELFFIINGHDINAVHEGFHLVSYKVGCNSFIVIQMVMLLISNSSNVSCIKYHDGHEFFPRLIL